MARSYKRNILGQFASVGGSAGKRNSKAGRLETKALRLRSSGNHRGAGKALRKANGLRALNARKGHGYGRPGGLGTGLSIGLR